MGLVIALIVLAVVLGLVGLFVAALKWLLIVAVVLAVVGLVRRRHLGPPRALTPCCTLRGARSATRWLTEAGRCARFSTVRLRTGGPMPADGLSRAFAALADPTRRDMVSRLATGDATVGELAEPYAMSVQAVSKHLRVLEDAGLVTRSRDAQRRPVHLEAEVFDLMTAWIERYRRQAEERYRRLDAVLATMPDDQGTNPTGDAT